MSDPRRLGSALFSVGDLYAKLKIFKSSIRDYSMPLYFAKVDVQSAFDTIPQSAVVRLMGSIPSESEYCISKHVELKPGEGWREGNSAAKPIRKWVSLAKGADDFQNFDENLESSLAVGRKNTVFIENIVSQFRDKNELMDLLAEHVQRNMVKIGKKFYRQREGIPQGSVLSSLLCNYFYADLEAHHLQFLQSGNSLLLRLIDDFLLITTDRAHAKKFIQIMHDGLPSYGVRVNPDKTLVNFEAVVNGQKVERLVGSRSFPYCGSFVDTKSLDISKDGDRRKDMGTSSSVLAELALTDVKPAIEDSLTVEFSRVPGKTFHRKILSKFQTISHVIPESVFGEYFVGARKPSDVTPPCLRWSHDRRPATQAEIATFICSNWRNSVTYDHRLRRTGHPVRSAIHKPQIGRLVVGWVTTSEYLLLYVF